MLLFHNFVSCSVTMTKSSNTHTGRAQEYDQIAEPINEGLQIGSLTENTEMRRLGSNRQTN